MASDKLTRFVFEGAIRNFPSPDVEKDNVNYLAGIREIAVRSEYTDGRDMPRLLIRSVEFEGPFYETWPPPSHRNIFIDSDPRKIIRKFATRAYRRPITAAEEASLMAVYQKTSVSGSILVSQAEDIADALARVSELIPARAASRQMPAPARPRLPWAVQRQKARPRKQARWSEGGIETHGGARNSTSASACRPRRCSTMPRLCRTNARSPPSRMTARNAASAESSSPADSAATPSVNCLARTGEKSCEMAPIGIDSRNTAAHANRSRARIRAKTRTARRAASCAGQ